MHNKTIAAASWTSSSHRGHIGGSNTIHKAFTLGVTYSANVGGVATMTAALPNIVFVGFLET